MVSQLKEAAREGVAETSTPESPPMHHVGCPPPITSSVSWKALTFVSKMLADNPRNHLLLERRLMGRGSIQLENLIHEDIGAFGPTGESNLDAAWVQEVATSPASCSPILLDSQHDLPSNSPPLAFCGVAKESSEEPRHHLEEQTEGGHAQPALHAPRGQHRSQPPKQRRQS